MVNFTEIFSRFFPFELFLIKFKSFASTTYWTAFFLLGLPYDVFGNIRLLFDKTNS